MNSEDMAALSHTLDPPPQTVAHFGCLFACRFMRSCALCKCCWSSSVVVTLSETNSLVDAGAEMPNGRR